MASALEKSRGLSPLMTPEIAAAFEVMEALAHLYCCLVIARGLQMKECALVMSLLEFGSDCLSQLSV